MLLPPILEVFVVWHPDDEPGQFVSRNLIDHFHGTAFSGLAGGAVEVYVRSEGWEVAAGAPRPLAPFEPWPNSVPKAQFTAIVPVLGTGMARAYQQDAGWRAYLDEIFGAWNDEGVGVYSVHPQPSDADISGTDLSAAAGPVQALHAGSAMDRDILCRELAQAIAQRLNADQGIPKRIKVFVSHTKHLSLEEDTDGPRLFDQVRDVISKTHLDSFFDASDLQPGSDWAEHLKREASQCALLMVRTDRYAGREWTQREVRLAKIHDVPTVGLYALRSGEDRGSFLMDHVPTVQCDLSDSEPGIMNALNRIADEALKRALWVNQSVYLKEHGFDWLPVHSPEPVTIAPWLQTHKEEHPDDDHVWVMHPDPPLGKDEREVIVSMCVLAGYSDNVDVFTPRTFAARGGKLPA